MRAGTPVVLEIEVQGARQVRAAMPDAVQVFIAPPSLARAAHPSDRAGHRRSPRESSAGCASPRRSSQAQPEFGYVVVNDRLEDALEQLSEIVGRWTLAGAAERALINSARTAGKPGKAQTK